MKDYKLAYKDEIAKRKAAEKEVKTMRKEMRTLALVLSKILKNEGKSLHDLEIMWEAVEVLSRIPKIQSFKGWP